jgi:hypothetical protein
MYPDLRKLSSMRGKAIKRAIKKDFRLRNTGGTLLRGINRLNPPTENGHH